MPGGWGVVTGGMDNGNGVVAWVQPIMVDGAGGEASCKTGPTYTVPWTWWVEC